MALTEEAKVSISEATITKKQVVRLFSTIAELLTYLDTTREEVLALSKHSPSLRQPHLHHLHCRPPRPPSPPRSNCPPLPQQKPKISRPQSPQPQLPPNPTPAPPLLAHTPHKGGPRSLRLSRSAPTPFSNRTIQRSTASRLSSSPHPFPSASPTTLSSPPPTKPWPPSRSSSVWPTAPPGEIFYSSPTPTSPPPPQRPTLLLFPPLSQLQAARAPPSATTQSGLSSYSMAFPPPPPRSN